MRFTKPAWVMHKDSAAKADETAKRLSIFSVHVHPDGSRIATGGLDAKIRIWSTKPILKSAAEASNKPPKSLCTLIMHTGPVLTVRWAHSGRWLASGSDDEIVMIWDLDPSARGKVWGSDEVNVEGWKPLKRLPGHESDVTDVAWSPGDRYLASVGLDSKVIVWCGFTLERLRKLDQHQGFVKGVCWDPVGEFLATQSDDRSVKIWRTSDWQLEAEVKKPFEDSPGSTFFRRLSWSPDGAHITASNATNNKGFVFIAAVITRNLWTSDISLVGHENTVEVAAYNPHIFLRNPSGPVATANICSVVALGADDRSVSVWQTKSARPLIVAKEVFERQIMDLSWSWDGLTLYAASSDGTIAVFDFDPEELEGIAPYSVQEKYLQKFGFVQPPLPEGFSHGASKNQNTPVLPSADASHLQPSTVFGNVSTGTPEKVNQLVAKRGKNKKRIQPILSSSIPSASLNPLDRSSNISIGGPTNGAFASQSRLPLVPEAQSRPSASTVGFGSLPPPQTLSQQSQSISQSHSYLSVDSSRSFGQDFGQDVDMDLGMDVPIISLDANGDSASTGKGKKKIIVDLTDDSKPSKPRTLGGDRPRDVVVVKELSSNMDHVVRSGSWNGAVLPMPPLLTYLSAKVEGSEDSLEGHNSGDNAGSVEVIFLNAGKQTEWLDYLASPVVALTATASFCAVAMQDGSVNVYSPTGRRIMPTMSLDSPCAAMDGNKNSLLVVTTHGKVYSWNIKKQSAIFPPTSLVTLFNNSPNTTMLSASIRPNGSPIIHCSNGIAYSYDLDLYSWVKLSDKWWSEGSDVWQGRQRGTSQSTARGVLVSIESSIATTSTPEEGAAEKLRPKWWSTAMTLGHLETKLHASRVLESPTEYKQVLLVYAKKIADEGFRGKAEELIKELFGPVYWRPGREDVWSPTVVGLTKRDLLRDVLQIFNRSKTLTKLAMDWQEILKKAGNDE